MVVRRRKKISGFFWVNVVTDSLPALALGVEKKEDGIMHRKPIPAGQSLFAGGLWRNILLEGAMIGSLALLAFVIGRTWFSLAVGRTMTFSVLCISQLVHALNMRSDRSLFRIGLFSNPKMTLAFFVCLAMQIAVVTVPALSVLFKTVPLNAVQSAIVAGLSAVPLIAVELEKARQNRP